MIESSFEPNFMEHTAAGIYMITSVVLLLIAVTKNKKKKAQEKELRKLQAARSYYNPYWHISDLELQLLWTEGDRNLAVAGLLILNVLAGIYILCLLWLCN